MFFQSQRGQRIGSSVLPVVTAFERKHPQCSVCEYKPTGIMSVDTAHSGRVA